MNVYMVNSGYDGCNYVRILLPAYHNGYKTSKDGNGVKCSPRDMQVALSQADIVVFHRPESKEYYNLAKILKANGKKIVVDNDDTFKLDDYYKLAEWSADAVGMKLKDRDKNMDKMMKLADLVTTSTEFLAKEYRKTSDNVVVLPNCVDPLDWSEPKRNEGDKVRIGMVGSVSYEYDYLHIKDVLRELSKRDDVTLVLFGLGDAKHRKKNPAVTKAFQEEYDFWDSIDKEQIGWVESYKYTKTLNEARLDMMLIPRKDNYFNRCKSNVKVLEASMCEVPCIAQSFENGPYEEFEHLENIVLVKNNDWNHYIDLLVNDKLLRRSLGKNAKEYTLKNYNIEDKYSLWEKAYKSLIK